MAEKDVTLNAVKYVELKIKSFFKIKDAPGHGIDHAQRVAKWAGIIAKKEGDRPNFCEIAGWLHDIGRVSEYFDNPQKKSHHELSFDLLKEWFKKDHKLARFFNTKEKEELLYGVRYHWDDAARDYISSIILRDADKLDLLGETGIKRFFVTHLKLDQIQNCIWFLINVLRGERLYTSTAQKFAEKHKQDLYGPFFDWIGKHLPKNKRVLCALSGGVDSAVAAYILKRAGFEVTGVFMKNWSEDTKLKGECAWHKERRDAMRVAAHIGIPFITFNFEKEYRKSVVEYIFKEYKKGRTPNPDIICNSAIKFPLLLKEADKLGFDYIATGHYARIFHNNGSKEYYLGQAVDKNKDQSYFLHQLTELQLSRTLFPLGFIKKNEVRVIAKQVGLPVAQKEESMGICFIGEVRIKDFLQQKIKPKIGNIVDVQGHVLGKHDGLYWYTEGQRHGLNIGGGIPYFVLKKDIKRNELVVGLDKNNKALFSSFSYLENVHWIKKQPILPFSCSIRLRHRQPLFEGSIKKISVRDRKLAPKSATHIVVFKEKQRAVTPGQFAVLYKGEKCLGGAVIAGRLDFKI